MIIDDPAVHAEITALFSRYETALGANDTATLDGLFWPSPDVVRFGVGEALFGAAAISAFRANRAGGSPPRRLGRVVIKTFGADFAVTNAEFTRAHERRGGRQSQTWVRLPGLGWRIVAAHVSLAAEIS
ncbi:oxalurate catabolism protein HpxZ [Acidiphilium sp.]|uniref:oxalurate catabolism protein HpxZ n=1 Tax=Acidiphilium sp. TaxID=527 RepID=UPI003D0938A0